MFAVQKVFQTLEAAKNEAYVPWTSVAPPSYQAYADLMDRLADDLAKYL
jgi:iron complex transport system substrate-binding protein